MSNTEPTPEEEAAARAKEAEEQAALPYKWTQTIGDLDITVEVPGNLKGKDLNVEIKKKKLLVGVKGQEPIINVCSFPLLPSPPPPAPSPSFSPPPLHRFTNYFVIVELGL